MCIATPLPPPPQHDLAQVRCSTTSAHKVHQGQNLNADPACTAKCPSLLASCPPAQSPRNRILSTELAGLCLIGCQPSRLSGNPVVAVSEAQAHACSKMKARWQRRRMHDGDVSELQSHGSPDEDERHALLRSQARQHQASAAAIEDAVGRACSVRQQPARGRQVDFAFRFVLKPCKSTD